MKHYRWRRWHVLAAAIPVVAGGALVTALATSGGSGHHAASKCVGGDLPDSTCTPGDVDHSVTVAILCAPGHSTAGRRNVPQSEKDKVKAEYGYTSGTFHGEIDHLVSLELGGSNNIDNLWPEAGPIPNAKDSIENRLHAAVCSGRVSLGVAQRNIATDWRTACQNVCATKS